MDINTNDDTMNEILMEDEQVISKSYKRRGCLFRTLVFMILLFIGILAFVFIQQYFLDLEAQAIVRAARTGTAISADTDDGTEMEQEKSSDNKATEPTGTPLPSPTATEDPAVERTATIAVQLTDVASFQLTATTNP